MSSMTRIKKYFADEEVAEIANEITNELPLSASQLQKAYSGEELKEIKKMIKEVRKATNKNKAIEKNASIVLKLLKGLGLDLGEKE